MNLLFSLVLIKTLSISSLAIFRNYNEFVEFAIINNNYSDVSHYSKINHFIDFDKLYFNFKVVFNKTYAVSNSEEEIRKFNFLRSLLAIEKNSKLLKNGDVTHQLGINTLADLSHDEYQNMQNKNVSEILKTLQKLSVKQSFRPSLELPKYFDWREQQKVTDVKDQGLCGACWVFAGIATIESAYAIKYNLTKKTLVSLSEQQVLDCAVGRHYVSKGCNGGTVIDAYRYVKSYGVVKQNYYPFVEQKTNCQKDEYMWKIYIKSYYYNTNLTDNGIMSLIYNKGPVAVLINSGDTDFQLYRKGIIKSIGSRDLDTSQTNHFVTVVGWGTENNVDFWIIKNSYGKNWGENGYFRLIRGIDSRAFNTNIFYPSMESGVRLNHYSSLNISFIIITCLIISE